MIVIIYWIFLFRGMLMAMKDKGKLPVIKLRKPARKPEAGGHVSTREIQHKGPKCNYIFNGLRDLH
jgi:hypothetical protein